MLLPAWLAGVLATALVGLLVTGIGWAIKSDRARAVESVQVQMELQQLRGEVGKLAALLERHSPQAAQGAIDALTATLKEQQAQHAEDMEQLRTEHADAMEAMQAKHDKATRLLRGKVGAHHGFIRDLQVRLASAGIPETGRTQRAAQLLDQAPDLDNDE